MTDDDLLKIRLAWPGYEKYDREHGIELCSHITLPNACTEHDSGYEYAEHLEIRCAECEQTYKLTVKVN